MALTIYRDTKSSQNLLPSLSVMCARRLNPLKCAYFDRLKAAVILINGLLSKYAKLIILKIYRPNIVIITIINVL